MKEELAKLPKIDGLMERADFRDLKAPRWALVEALRAEVGRLRKAILAGQGLGQVDVARVKVDALERVAQSLRPVVNATGVVLHTNLGRAPISKEVLERLTDVASGYSNLEYDLRSGKRGSRHHHVVAGLRRVTGAEDAVVVNNCAAAVMLVLAALAEGQEVVVSRGELVEIGGSFRVPEVMRLSGATLREVGTTNRTRKSDYADACGGNTAVLLKVHQANFEIVGFTEETSVAEVAQVGKEKGVISMMDLGSGSLLSGQELAEMGLSGEPTAPDVLAQGIDIITFSGDKLLGGPQAGIIAGRKDLIAKVRKHQLMRALRPDKLTIAALEVTISAFRDQRADEVPAHAMLSASPEVLRARAEELHASLSCPASVHAELIECQSTAGGGSKPGSSLPSWAVALHSETYSPTVIADALRYAATPVIARVQDERVLLDVRTLFRDSDRALVAQAVAAMELS